ncbi:MAG: GGDEF domain-containing protein [Alphaproteobacteria bacterium]|nr:GGDEF domain-containing protein [Alphaproteobacteria bacterium]
MTTDIIKNRDAEKALMNSGALFRNMLVRTRSNGTPKHTTRPALPALPTALAEPAPETFDPVQDGAHRLVSNTMALLDYANRLIEAAEQHIAAQESRIEQLTTLSITDELTGLRNRRGFYESFMAELDRCDREQSIGGLMVLIDLDNFKAINDTHGHPAGDACLRLVARTIADQVRAMDTTARLGGDEFVILLSNTTKGDAAKRAQTLAWQLNNLALAWYGEEIPVRASLGLKSFGAGDSADKIFSAADLQLYATKTFRSRKRTLDQADETVVNAEDLLACNTQHEVKQVEQNPLREGPANPHA